MPYIDYYGLKSEKGHICLLFQNHAFLSLKENNKIKTKIFQESSFPKNPKLISITPGLFSRKFNNFKYKIVY